MFKKCCAFSALCFGLISYAEQPTTQETQKQIDQVHYLKVNETVDFNKANPGTKEDVSYQLFTRDNPKKGTDVSYDNIGSALTHKNIPLVVFIHGWKDSPLASTWYKDLTKAFFIKSDVNLIWVNWVYAGNMTYNVSAANVKGVGGYIAEFLENSKVKGSQIQIVSHSLGSQLAHYVSKSFENSTGQKFQRITALDPTGVLFQSLSEDKRLTKVDAVFVDATHSNSDLFGYTSPIGHVDFYPNGGNKQPGCPPDSTKDTCNHQRAPQYFIASFYKNASAVEANYKQPKPYYSKVTPKIGGKTILYGQFVPHTARGVFYFTTLSSKPFLLNTYNLVN